MLKYVTPSVVFSAVFNIAVYLMVLLLNYYSGNDTSEGFFGRILTILLYIGPLLILISTAKSIIHEKSQNKK
jgi:hypothetical protein